mmetsp:Transcript_107817/g.300590  ORF Transcript_107817/g.300590 Transcript_107817/m.300590 type:complete len:104 (+) Transcript_107817:76-387(+)
MGCGSSKATNMETVVDHEGKEHQVAKGGAMAFCADFDSIPTFRVSEGKLEGDKRCPICMDLFAFKELLNRLPCGHCVHACCMEQHFAQNRDCPKRKKPLQAPG